jgi:hypothetical protein
MRLSRLISSTFVVAVAGAATIFACGGGGGGGNPDAKVYMDAKVFMDANGSGSNGVNALGQICNGTMTCPPGNDCVTIMNAGSGSNGFCTPMCMGSNANCAAGYTGPAGGQPVCALTMQGSSTPNGCAIICTDVSQCPTGNGCITIGSNSAKICYPN